MADKTNSTELKLLNKSKVLKVCYWFTNACYYLSFFCVFLVLTLITVDFVTGDKVLKYMHLPVVVTYDNAESNLPLDQVKSDELMPVVGFRQLQLDVSNFNHMAQNMWIPLILLMGLIYILFLFRLFLRTVRENSPFAPENPQRLKRIGFLVTIAGPVAGIFNYIYASIYIHFINLPGATIEIHDEIYPFAIFLGLMIIVIAYVFDVAVKMKIEQDLTI